MLWTAAAGWVLVICLAVQAARLSYRLHLVARPTTSYAAPCRL
jgi:hypothetical protein